MAILVVADIHSNLAAFEAVIADAEARGGGIDAVWCLGDVVGYGPEPGACIDLLRSYRNLCVAGNHDLGVIGMVPLDDFKLAASAAARWTTDQLNDSQKSWLRALPRTATEGDFTLVHGSLDDPVWEYLKSSLRAHAHLQKQTTPYGFVGHSHICFAFYEEGGRNEAVRGGDGVELPLAGRRVVANGGSVGQPRDGDPRAAYALVDAAMTKISFYRVAYDIKATQEKMRAAHLPFELIERLSAGR
jgi:diadenosine tetraphosphatase ApaH/serine/threonine PP2A family protein phosphatase